jgi:hypothetical protein
MFFDVVFRIADQVWGVDQSYLLRLFSAFSPEKEEDKGVIGKL